MQMMCTVYDVLVAAKASIVLLSQVPSIVPKQENWCVRRRILSSSDASSKCLELHVWLQLHPKVAFSLPFSSVFLRQYLFSVAPLVTNPLNPSNCFELQQWQSGSMSSIKPALVWPWFSSWSISSATCDGVLSKGKQTSGQGKTSTTIRMLRLMMWSVRTMPAASFRMTLKTFQSVWSWFGLLLWLWLLLTLPLKMERPCALRTWCLLASFVSFGCSTQSSTSSNSGCRAALSSSWACAVYLDWWSWWLCVHFACQRHQALLGECQE